jgi:sortase A
MRVRLFIERLFLVVGLGMIAVWAWSEARYTVWQDWGNWVFERELRQQPASAAEYVKEKSAQLTGKVREWLRLRPESAPPPSASNESSPAATPKTPVKTSPETNALLGRLNIPRLHLSATVREGADEETLAVALGHIPATALPGQPGNVGIAGHRDKLFRSLKDIRSNDLIELQTLSGNYVYQVESTQIVKPTDVSVLKAANYSELTLVTCYPFYFVGAAPDRFIVKARQLVLKPTMQATPVVQTASTQVVPSEPPAVEVAHHASPGRIGFQIPKDHSRQLAPGIWFGVTETDVTSQWVSGWMWLMPDRKTIYLRKRGADEPVVFYSMRDGKRRELKLTNITTGAVTGYLSPSE